MFKGKTVIIISIFIFSFALFSCANNKNLNSNNIEEIFSLNTTSCMGTCPVFELSLYGDQRLVFNGKENTKVSGKKEVILNDEQYEALRGLIESADWVNLKDEYRTDTQDLPTQNFTYNQNGVIKNVSRNGAGPESISNLSDTILKFVEEQVFKKE